MAESVSRWKRRGMAESTFFRCTIEGKLCFPGKPNTGGGCSGEGRVIRLHQGFGGQARGERKIERKRPALSHTPIVFIRVGKSVRRKELDGFFAISRVNGARGSGEGADLAGVREEPFGLIGKRVGKMLKEKELDATGERIFAEDGREDTKQLRVLSRDTNPLYDRSGGNARVKLRYSIVDRCC